MQKPKLPIGPGPGDDPLADYTPDWRSAASAADPLADYTPDWRKPKAEPAPKPEPTYQPKRPTRLELPIQDRQDIYDIARGHGVTSPERQAFIESRWKDDRTARHYLGNLFGQIVAGAADVAHNFGGDWLLRQWERGVPIASGVPVALKRGPSQLELLITGPQKEEPTLLDRLREPRPETAEGMIARFALPFVALGAVTKVAGAATGALAGGAAARLATRAPAIARVLQSIARPATAGSKFARDVTSGLPIDVAFAATSKPEESGAALLGHVAEATGHPGAADMLRSLSETFPGRLAVEGSVFNVLPTAALHGLLPTARFAGRVLRDETAQHYMDMAGAPHEAAEQAMREAEAALEEAKRAEERAASLPSDHTQLLALREQKAQQREILQRTGLTDPETTETIAGLEAELADIDRKLGTLPPPAPAEPAAPPKAPTPKRSRKTKVTGPMAAAVEETPPVTPASRPMRMGASYTPEQLRELEQAQAAPTPPPPAPAPQALPPVNPVARPMRMGASYTPEQLAQIEAERAAAAAPPPAPAPAPPPEPQPVPAPVPTPAPPPPPSPPAAPTGPITAGERVLTSAGPGTVRRVLGSEVAVSLDIGPLSYVPLDNIERIPVEAAAPVPPAAEPPRTRESAPAKIEAAQEQPAAPTTFGVGARVKKKGSSIIEGVIVRPVRTPASEKYGRKSWEVRTRGGAERVYFEDELELLPQGAPAEAANIPKGWVDLGIGLDGRRYIQNPKTGDVHAGKGTTASDYRFESTQAAWDALGRRLRFPEGQGRPGFVYGGALRPVFGGSSGLLAGYGLAPAVMPPRREGESDEDYNRRLRAWRFALGAAGFTAGMGLGISPELVGRLRGEKGFVSKAAEATRQALGEGAALSDRLEEWLGPARARLADGVGVPFGAEDAEALDRLLRVSTPEERAAIARELRRIAQGNLDNHSVSRAEEWEQAARYAENPSGPDWVRAFADGEPPPDPSRLPIEQLLDNFLNQAFRSIEEGRPFPFGPQEQALLHRLFTEMPERAEMISRVARSLSEANRRLGRVEDADNWARWAGYFNGAGATPSSVEDIIREAGGRIPSRAELWADASEILNGPYRAAQRGQDAPLSPDEVEHLIAIYRNLEDDQRAVLVSMLDDAASFLKERYPETAKQWSTLAARLEAEPPLGVSHPPQAEIDLPMPESPDFEVPRGWADAVEETIAEEPRLADDRGRPSSVDDLIRETGGKPPRGEAPPRIEGEEHPASIESLIGEAGGRTEEPRAPLDDARAVAQSISERIAAGEPVMPDDETMQRFISAYRRAGDTFRSDITNWVDSIARRAKWRWSLSPVAPGERAVWEPVQRAWEQFSQALRSDRGGFALIGEGAHGFPDVGAGRAGEPPARGGAAGEGKVRTGPLMPFTGGFLGASAGSALTPAIIERRPGESDEHYRQRLLLWRLGFAALGGGLGAGAGYRGNVKLIEHLLEREKGAVGYVPTKAELDTVRHLSMDQLNRFIEHGNPELRDVLIAERDRRLAEIEGIARESTPQAEQAKRRERFDRFLRSDRQGAVFVGSVGDEPGESVIGAGIDESIKEKWAQLYSGNLATITTKEGIQNAVDATAGVAGGRVDVDIDPSRGAWTITDNGVGIPPSIVKTKWIDFYGSFKPGDAAAGGFGIGMTGPLARSKEFTLNTIWRDEKNGRRLHTLVTGSGADMLNGRLKVKTVALPLEGPTGTRLTIQYPDDVNLDFNEARLWLRRYMRYNRSVPVHVTVSGRDFKPGDVYDWQYNTTAEMPSRPTSTESVPGAEMEFYHIGEKQRRPGVNYHVLNNGIYQYSGRHYLNRTTEAPEEVVVNVRPTVPTSDDRYPFPQSREELRADAAEAFRRHMGNLESRQAAAKLGRMSFILREPLRLLDAEGRPTPFGVYATDPNVPVERIAEILQGRKYPTRVAEAVAGVGREMYQLLRRHRALRDIPEPEFGGLGVQGKWLGLNVQRTRLEELFDEADRRARWAGADREGLTSPEGLAGLPNLILHNPWVTLAEILSDYPAAHVIPEMAAPALARETVNTLAHEIVHQKWRRHDNNFAGALTRILTDVGDAQEAYIQRLMPVYQRALADGMQDDLRRFREVWSEENLLEEIADEYTGRRGRGRTPGRGAEGEAGADAAELAERGDAAGDRAGVAGGARPVGAGAGAADAGDLLPGGAGGGEAGGGGAELRGGAGGGEENPLEGTRVVDANGQPRIVYHGTTRVFTDYDPEKLRVGLTGRGYYHVEDPAAAEPFSRGVGRLAEPEEAPNIRPARLAIKRPFDMDAPVEGVPGNPTGADFYQGLIDRYGDEDGANAALREMGYDGITMKFGGSRMWMAFDRSQIRSPWGPAESAIQFGSFVPFFGVAQLGQHALDQYLNPDADKKDWPLGRVAVLGLLGAALAPPAWRRRMIRQLGRVLKVEDREGIRALAEGAHSIGKALREKVGSQFTQYGTDPEGRSIATMVWSFRKELAKERVRVGQLVKDAMPDLVISRSTDLFKGGKAPWKTMREIKEARARIQRAVESVAGIDFDGNVIHGALARGHRENLPDDLVPLTAEEVQEAEKQLQQLREIQANPELAAEELDLDAGDLATVADDIKALEQKLKVRWATDSTGQVSYTPEKSKELWDALTDEERNIAIRIIAPEHAAYGLRARAVLERIGETQQRLEELKRAFEDLKASKGRTGVPSSVIRERAIQLTQEIKRWTESYEDDLEHFAYLAEKAREATKRGIKQALTKAELPNLDEVSRETMRIVYSNLDRNLEGWMHHRGFENRKEFLSFVRKLRRWIAPVAKHRMGQPGWQEDIARSLHDALLQVKEAELKTKLSQYLEEAATTPKLPGQSAPPSDEYAKTPYIMQFGRRRGQEAWLKKRIFQDWVEEMRTAGFSAISDPKAEEAANVVRQFLESGTRFWTKNQLIAMPSVINNLSGAMLAGLPMFRDLYAGRPGRALRYPAAFMQSFPQFVRDLVPYGPALYGESKYGAEIRGAHFLPRTLAGATIGAGAGGFLDPDNPRRGALAGMIAGAALGQVGAVKTVQNLHPSEFGETFLQQFLTGVKEPKGLSFLPRTAIGAGAGAAYGALTGKEGEKGERAVKGALVGSLLGQSLALRKTHAILDALLTPFHAADLYIKRASASVERLNAAEDAADAMIRRGELDPADRAAKIAELVKLDHEKLYSARREQQELLRGIEGSIDDVTREMGEIQGRLSKKRKKPLPQQTKDELKARLQELENHRKVLARAREAVEAQLKATSADERATFEALDQELRRRMIVGPDYALAPTGLNRFQRSPFGQMTSPFLKSGYFEGRSLFKYLIEPILDERMPQRERLARVAAALTMIAPWYYWGIKSEEGSEAQIVTQEKAEHGMDYSVDRSGRLNLTIVPMLGPAFHQFAGSDPMTNELHLRGVKYPFADIGIAASAIATGDTEGLEQAALDKLTPGFGLQAALQAAGYRNKYQTHRETPSIWGDWARSFVPAHRLFEDAGDVRWPLAYRPQTFGQSAVGELVRPFLGQKGAEAGYYGEPRGDRGAGYTLGRFMGEPVYPQIRENPRLAALRLALGINVRDVPRARAQAEQQETALRMLADELKVEAKDAYLYPELARIAPMLLQMDEAQRKAYWQRHLREIGRVR